MVGVAGSGKSTFAKRMKKNLGYFGETTKIISSDDYRMTIFGSLEEGNKKGNSVVVFERMKDDLRGVVKHSVYDQVVYDATNLNRGRRRSLYQNIKQWNSEAVVEIVYFSLPLHEIYLRNRNRAKEQGVYIPKEVIKHMYINMQVPRIGVDCDSIQVEGLKMFNDLDYQEGDTLAGRFINASVNGTQFELARLFDSHDCAPYHLESIDEHIEMCVKNALEPTLYPHSLVEVAKFHDLGKSVTKVMKTKDGVSKGTYQGHANVGANYFLNYKVFTERAFDYYDSDIMETIHQHMNAHQGLGKKNIKRNKLGEKTISLIEAFKEIDSQSRITGEGV